MAHHRQKVLSVSLLYFRIFVYAGKVLVSIAPNAEPIGLSQSY